MSASHSRLLSTFVFLLLALLLPARARSQESPYLVTYDHYLEEPGNLEIEYFSTFGTQHGGNDFHARSFISMAKPPLTTARFLPGSAGKIGFVLLNMSISSIR